MSLDDSDVTRVIFHPRPEPFTYRPRGIATNTECEGASIGGYLHNSPSSDALILLFHGNGEIAGDYDSLAPLYLDLGVSLWVVDYRGYGRSSGTPSYSDMLEDAGRILADVPRVGDSVGREFKSVIVMGRSLGSASAIHLASSRPHHLAGLILDSAFADGLALISRLGGPALARDALSGFDDNLDKMKRCELPTLIIHGLADRIIPLADAEALYGACPSDDRRIIRIDGAGHNDLLVTGYSQYHDGLCGFVKGSAGAEPQI